MDEDNSIFARLKRGINNARDNHPPGDIFAANTSLNNFLSMADRAIDDVQRLTQGVRNFGNRLKNLFAYGDQREEQGRYYEQMRAEEAQKGELAYKAMYPDYEQVAATDAERIKAGLQAIGQSVKDGEIPSRAQLEELGGCLLKAAAAEANQERAKDIIAQWKKVAQSYKETREQAANVAPQLSGPDCRSARHEAYKKSVTSEEYERAQCKVAPPATISRGVNISIGRS